ncbi:hypothetical protein GCM10018952_56870 [Streptosporangium vulgare]
MESRGGQALSLEKPATDRQGQRQDGLPLAAPDVDAPGREAPGGVRAVRHGPVGASHHHDLVGSGVSQRPDRGRAGGPEVVELRGRGPGQLGDQQRGMRAHGPGDKHLARLTEPCLQSSLAGRALSSAEPLFGNRPATSRAVSRQEAVRG